MKSIHQENTTPTSFEWVEQQYQKIALSWKATCIRPRGRPLTTGRGRSKGHS